MNKPLIVPNVTVTVPVYNTSRYLCKCLDSLANQTLSDIEVILVDDGSTDGSGTICDEYAEKYALKSCAYKRSEPLRVVTACLLHNDPTSHRCRLRIL